MAFLNALKTKISCKLGEFAANTIDFYHQPALISVNS